MLNGFSIFKNDIVWSLITKSIYVLLHHSRRLMYFPAFEMSLLR